MEIDTQVINEMMKVDENEIDLMKQVPWFNQTSVHVLFIYCFWETCGLYSKVQYVTWHYLWKRGLHSQLSSTFQIWTMPHIDTVSVFQYYFLGQKCVSEACKIEHFLGEHAPLRLEGMHSCIFHCKNAMITGNQFFHKCST